LLFSRSTLAFLEADVMTASRTRIQDLVLRIQSDYLDDPTLSLTLSAAAKRFGIDQAACAGVLGALVDAGVLTERAGNFRRLLRRPVRHAA
jgi:hypothetical protein